MDKELLDSFHEQFMRNDELQNAIKIYFMAHGATMPKGIRFTPGIDYVEARIDDIPILIIGLPPVSDYFVRETEYTNEYTHPQMAVAV